MTKQPQLDTSRTPAFQVNAFAFCISLLLALVTVLVYLPVRHHSFLLFDDADYVTDNHHVQAGLTWAGVNWAFTTGHTGNWHPLTWLSHMLDVQLFGISSMGPHMVNVLFHVANTVLLFILLRRLTGALWCSAWVAALFALHPLHVESVAWVAERKDVLSAFFFLLTLWAYARYAQCRSRAESRALLWPSTLDYVLYVLALFSFALGLMCKPMLVTLPFVLLLLDYWPLQRFDASTVQHTVVEKVPFFLLSALSSGVTFAAQKSGGAVRSLASFPVSERMENALVSYARYLGKTFWPVDLAVFYPHPGHWPAEQVVSGAILVAGLCLGVVWFGRRFPFAVTGWFWFLGMLVPTIGLVQVSNQSMADRYTYLPSIGIFIILAWGAREVSMRWRFSKAVIGIGAGLTVIACAVRTEGQLHYWQDSESLFRHALAVTKGNFVAHNNLGSTLLQKGQVAEAIDQFRQALEVRPDYADAYCNLGSALLQKRRADEAIAQFRKALEVQPNHPLARYNLATTLLQNGRVNEAIAQFQNAVEIRPDDPLTHLNLGNALLQKGRLDEAVAQYQKVLEIQPDDADAHNNLGSALLKKGRLDEAAAQFQQALQIDPNHANAHHNLADIFLQQGRLDEAIARYQETLLLQPDCADAHNNLGIALLQQGRMNEAIGHFQKAVEIQPGYADAHNNLGYILLQTGHAREATVHLETALKLQPDNARTLSNLAWVLATCPEASVRNGTEAIELARRANQLSDGQDPVVLRALAAAYAEGGRFAEATTVAEHALKLAIANSNMAMADSVRAQLRLYQAGSPSRDNTQTDGDNQVQP